MANVGKGHIERLLSGSYRVRVYAGNDPLTGKEIRLKATAKTAEHAQAELARLLEQASVGQQPESAATVGYLLDQYMAVADLDVSTREGYEGYIRRTIKPALVGGVHCMWAISVHRCRGFGLGGGQPDGDLPLVAGDLAWVIPAGRRTVGRVRLTGETRYRCRAVRRGHRSA